MQDLLTFLPLHVRIQVRLRPERADAIVRRWLARAGPERAAQFQLDLLKIIRSRREEHDEGLDGG